MLFLAFLTKGRERRQEAENQIVKLCTENVALDISPNDIDGAHRLGRFREKNRPVVEKVCCYKVNENVLSNAYKLKRTAIAIGKNPS